jgi:hypothetical protein
MLKDEWEDVSYGAWRNQTAVASGSEGEWVDVPTAPAPIRTWADNPIESGLRSLAGNSRIPIIGGIAEGVWQGANDLGGLAARAGLGDADAMNAIQNEETQRFTDAQGDGFVPRTVAGAARSLTQTLPIALGAGLAAPAVGIAARTAAMYAPIAGATATTANQAVSEGRREGLSGWDLAGHVAGQAIPEGAIAGAMNIVGAGGMEKVLGDLFKDGAVKAGRTLAQTITEYGFDFGMELTEENATSLAQAVGAKLSGVDPESLTYGNLKQTILDTTAQTALSMGLVYKVENDSLIIVSCMYHYQ